MRRTLLLATAVVATNACYDSSWGATKRAQTHNAARAMPATLGATSDEGKPPPRARAYRVRVYATPGYATQNLDYSREIRGLVDAGNEILGPGLGAHLEIESLATWSDAGSEDDLDKVLAALHAKDAGSDVDWVVGFVGAIPKLTDSFHDVGMGDNPGKYLVVRAASRLDDRVAIDRAFDQLGQDERSRVARARKEHRGVSVFLHEIGHTLGAVHEIDPSSVMDVHYDPKMSGYTAEALSLMRPSLAARREPQTADSGAALAKQLIGALEGPSAGAWVAADRDAMLSRLRGVSATAASPPPTPVANVPELNEGDRAGYAQALQLSQAGDVEGSSKAAAPLFTRYPNVYAVQDLRCQLAMKRVGWPAAQPECAALVSITRTPKRP